MQYLDVLRVLNPEQIAFRNKWSFETTTDHILVEDGKVFKNTKSSGKFPFIPSMEEMNCNDWTVIKKPQVPTAATNIPIQKCPDCKIGTLLPYNDYLKCNNCGADYDFPEKQERQFTFHDYNEKNEIVNTRVVKESDLTKEDCFILAESFWGQFNLLPATAQDFFMRKAINEAMAAQDEAIAEKTPASKIITDLN